jgi:hypothetical protein
VICVTLDLSKHDEDILLEQWISKQERYGDVSSALSLPENPSHTVRRGVQEVFLAGRAAIISWEQVLGTGYRRCEGVIQRTDPFLVRRLIEVMCPIGLQQYERTSQRSRPRKRRA